MSPGELQHLFRVYRDEAELAKDIEKKQSKGGRKPSECGNLEARRESISRRKEESTVVSNGPDRSSKLRAEK